MHIDSFYAGNLQLGEGIYYEELRGLVWWVDILSRQVYRSTTDGTDLQCWSTPELVGFVLPCSNEDQYWLGLQSGPHLATLQAGHVPDFSRLGTVNTTSPRVRVNDGSLAADGGLYVATMDMDARQPLGKLLHYDPAGYVTELATNFVIANGPASPPGQPVVYVVESEGHSGRQKGIYTVDLQNRIPTELLLVAWVYAGSPDSVSMDATGTLWVGTYGDNCIRQFATTGRLLRTIALPALNLTKVARAGNRLFVTSAATGVSDQQRQQYPLTGHVLVLDDID